VPHDWSDDIVVVELGDEPQLGDELGAMIERAEGRAGAGGAVKHVVLNFGAVRYLSSSHLAQMIRLRKLLKDAGRQLMLCSVNDQIWSVMLTSGLDRVFRYAPDTMTALATLQLEEA
jgi:anti-anti-sigma factor